MRMQKFLVVESVVEVNEDGPEHSSGEEHGENFAASGDVEAPSGVGCVTLAEAVFQSGAQTAFTGTAEMEALRQGCWIDFILNFHLAYCVQLSHTFANTRKIGRGQFEF